MQRDVGVMRSKTPLGWLEATWALARVEVERRWIIPNVITRRKQSGWNAPPGMLLMRKVYRVWRQRAYEKSLYFLLRLAVNIKLL